MKKVLRSAVLLAAAIALLLTGCGNKVATPTPNANVPVVSETPAIQSPDMSALVSTAPSTMPTSTPSPTVSTGTNMTSPKT